MIPLYKPFFPLLPELNEVITSGQLAYGKYGKLLENELSLFIGNPFCLVINSYSNAILLALLTLGIKKGDKVVISPLVCLATSQPISSLGIELVFCDVDMANGSIDSNELNHILQTEKIACVIITHYAGIIGNVEGISKVCANYSVPVIEDGSDAFGSMYKNKYVGNNGFDVTIFSFSAVRNPNMIDSGGITFSKKYLYDKAYLIRDAGIDRTKFRNQLGEIDLSNDISLPGIGATQDEVRSYIGLKQFEVLDSLIRKNQSNMYQIAKILLQSGVVEPIVTDLNRSNGWVLPIRVTNKLNLIKLFKEAGVVSSSVHSIIAYYSINNNQKRMENAEKFLDSFLSIPCGWWIEDLDEYINKIMNIISVS